MAHIFLSLIVFRFDQRFRSDFCVFGWCKISVSIFEEQSKIDGMRVMGNLVMMIDSFIILLDELRFEEIIMLMIMTFQYAASDELLEVIIDGSSNFFKQLRVIYLEYLE